MSHVPQKPDILRPPGLPNPSGVPVFPRSFKKRISTGKTGLAVSAAFHACLIAIAWSITFSGSAERVSDGEDDAANRGEFEMALPANPPQPSVSSSRSAPVAFQIPMVSLPGTSATLEMPPMEPFILLAPNSEPALPSTPPRAAQNSPAPDSGARSANVGNRTGTDHGKATKHATPVPPPKLLRNPPPRYPAAARAAKQSGKVAVLIHVRADGTAASTSVYQTSGVPSLDQAAVAAARAWTFSSTPSLGSGATVSVVVRVTFTL